MSTLKICVARLVAQHREVPARHERLVHLLQVKPGLDQVRRALRREAQVRDGLARPAEALQAEAEIAAQLGDVGCQAHGLREGIRRLAEVL